MKLYALFTQKIKVSRVRIAFLLHLLQQQGDTKKRGHTSLCVSLSGAGSAYIALSVTIMRWHSVSLETEEGLRLGSFAIERILCALSSLSQCIFFHLEKVCYMSFLLYTFSSFPHLSLLSKADLFIPYRRRPFILIATCCTGDRN